MKPLERCGVIGIHAFEDTWKIARFIYYGLLALQHRGQETSGQSTYSGKISAYKSSGYVDRIFSEEVIERLPGWTGIGHVGPTPTKEASLIQPIVVDRPFKLAFAYNGLVLNPEELASERRLRGRNDAQVFAELLSHELASSDPLEAVAAASEAVKGPFSFVALTEKGEMIAGRDPTGLRPLVVGSFGFDYGAVASESCALDIIGADYKADVKPGESYLFTPYHIERRQISRSTPMYCAFEYVYFARPDSFINERSVYEVRMEMGKRLATESGVREADAVIGIPATAVPFGMAYSNETEIPIQMGFVQTGRAVRSAIKPTQLERLMGVQLKLNPIRPSIRGKRILMIDDSVVRGTTTKNTVNLIRNRIGAKEVHVRIGSPRLVSPCPFGVEVPSKDELIAAHLDEDEVAKVVGADSFRWLSLRSLIEAIGIPRERLCLGCFGGRTPNYGVG
ncbi:MAG: amidophosphoribosyltransferase [Candidatus Bathyarchaeia archaeon]